MNKSFLTQRLIKIIYYNLNSRKLNCLNYRLITNNNILSQHFSNIVSPKKKFPTSEIPKINLSKDKLIKEMNFKCDEDAEPFYQLSISELFNLYKVTKIDNNLGYCTNRLYYVADQIKCDPKVLSEIIIKRTFIYTHSFDWIESSLKVLLDMGVSGKRILRDLFVLKYHHKTIEERLHKVKIAGGEEVYPWMVRCSMTNLDSQEMRNIALQNIYSSNTCALLASLNVSFHKHFSSLYIKNTQETKEILKEKKSTLQYLATRLDTSIDEIENMCQKVPSLWTIRVIKVKGFLDYLLSEGFTKEDIINKPSILASSLSTTSQRIDHLRSLGVTNINLNILTRGKKGFQKHIDSLTALKKY